jgi:hypothetical protein
MRNVILLLLVLPALLSVGHGAEPPKKRGEAASIEKVELQGEAKPGASLVAVVRVKLEKDWHVQSNKPSEPTFIPTVLTLAPTAGVKIGTIRYPQGKSETVQGLSKPLSVYDEDFQITVLLNLDAHARLPMTVAGTLTYQACQGAQCYPPKKLKVEIPIGVESRPK